MFLTGVLGKAISPIFRVPESERNLLPQYGVYTVKNVNSEMLQLHGVSL
jgi:hypothetical protein